MKRSVFRAGLVAIAGIALSACMADVDNVRELETKAGGYNAELASGYRQLAIYEADEMHDWLDARTFARKAIAAANSLPTAPENPQDWKLDQSYRPEVEDAYARLIDALSGDFPERASSSAAFAQVSFDCWIEQLEEGWQLDHIATCKAQFDTAMEDATTVPPLTVAPLTTHSKMKPEFAEYVGAEDDPMVQCNEDQRVRAKGQRYRVQFLHDDAYIGEQDLAILTDIANRVNAASTGALFVSGHADRSGSNSHNLQLSFDRVVNVWRALVERGVSPTRVWISAHGELTTEIQTADGERDLRNRRVLIDIDRFGTEMETRYCEEATS